MGRKPKNSTITEPISPNSVPEDANVLQKAAEIEDLIAALCVNAPSDDVKFCLRSYQPGKRVQRIKQDIENNFKKDTLLATCKYL